MTPTLTALTGFVAWSLFLLVLMELIRSKLVLTGAVPATSFARQRQPVAFMQRLRGRTRTVWKGCRYSAV